eukprot:TRINITY_DN1273_c0_g1_i2.p2 TRINITY_DN1273_c0_g1~~TRINITY_DN1273_c0_g1_i2.p2  ORF type:complete len:112 (+),score=7.38 TRINITY_DN1273_c0_g1_i2:120-455(+)
MQKLFGNVEILQIFLQFKTDRRFRQRGFVSEIDTLNSSEEFYACVVEGFRDQAQVGKLTQISVHPSALGKGENSDQNMLGQTIQGHSLLNTFFLLIMLGLKTLDIQVLQKF